MYLNEYSRGLQKFEKKKILNELMKSFFAFPACVAVCIYPCAFVENLKYLLCNICFCFSVWMLFITMR